MTLDHYEHLQDLGGAVRAARRAGWCGAVMPILAPGFDHHAEIVPMGMRPYVCTLRCGHTGEHEARASDGFTWFSWIDPVAK